MIKWNHSLSIIAGTLGAGALLWFRPGCEKKSPTISKKNPGEVPIEPDPRFKCLVPGQCSESAYVNLVQEYVGLVYGDEKSPVVFDGNPKRFELEYVRKKFGGELKRAGDVDAYLSWAKTHLPLSSPQNCADDDFGFGSRHSSLGYMLFFSGPEECDERLIGYYQKLELAIARNPGLWVFFVQGSSMMSRPDDDFFAGLAERLEIPVADIAPPLWDLKEVLPLLEKRLGLSRSEIGVSIAYGVLEDYLARLKDERVISFVNQALARHAERFNIPEEEFRRTFFTHITVPEGVDGAEFFKKRREVYSRIIGAYSEVVEQLLPEHIKTELKRTGKKYALYKVSNDYLAGVLKTNGVQESSP